MDTATGTVSRWRNHLREETNEFDDKRYSDGSGVAWWVLGYEVEADEDTEWSGYYNRTGNILAVMVGDDRPFAFDLSDLKEISDDDYCSVCGQIGCHHNA